MLQGKNPLRATEVFAMDDGLSGCSLQRSKEKTGQELQCLRAKRKQATQNMQDTPPDKRYRDHAKNMSLSFLKHVWLLGIPSKSMEGSDK